MSITDVQRSFARGLDGKGSCKTAAIDMEDGGRRQRLSFHVVGPTGAAYLSESIPIDMCPMQHARHMAIEFMEGRIAGNSRFETRALTQIQTPTTRNATPPNATPSLQEVPQAAHAPTVAPVRAETVAPALTPDESAPAPVDELDQALAAGDLAGVKDIVCGWIDADAGAIRRVWVSDNPGIALEYEQVRREINDIAYGLVEPSPEAFPCLWASVGTDVPKTGDDVADIRSAAQLINDCIDATSGFLARVRSVRLTAKNAIRAAPTAEDALELYRTVEWPVA